MILLSEKLIRKIDRLRLYNKVNIRVRFTYIAIICAWVWYSRQNNTFENYCSLIIALLLSTFIINLISDMLKSEVENILDAIEYDKSKIKYNSLDSKF